MERLQSLPQSSVGKKILMAATGFVLVAFVVVHMLGNLKAYLGAEHFNEYARFLRTAGAPAIPENGVLWIERVVLLACVGVVGICRLAHAFSDPRAIARCMVCATDGSEEVLGVGVVRDIISEAPRGRRGFGWDSAFVPDGSSRTYGEMDIGFLFRTGITRKATPRNGTSPLPRAVGCEGTATSSPAPRPTVHPLV